MRTVPPESPQAAAPGLRWRDPNSRKSEANALMMRMLAACCKMQLCARRSFHLPSIALFGCWSYFGKSVMRGFKIPHCVVEA